MSHFNPDIEPRSKPVVKPIQKSRLADFLLATAFLTRLPIRMTGHADGDRLRQTFWAWPLVGAGIGLVSAALYNLALLFSLPPLLAAFLAITSSILLSGALHEDGIADCADGLFGGNHPEQRLAIMRDSRSGVYGVIALILSIGLRVSALTALPIALAGPILVIVHAGARWNMLLPMLLISPARSDGLAASLWRSEKTMLKPIIQAGLGLGLILISWLLILQWLAREGFMMDFISFDRSDLLWAVILGLAGSVSLTLLVGVLARMRIGGFNGDVLGATEQLSEISLLLVYAALL